MNLIISQKVLTKFDISVYYVVLLNTFNNLPNGADWTISRSVVQK